MSYDDCVEEDAVGAMKEMTVLLNAYKWVHVSENDPLWLKVQKHLWNSQDTVEDVIRKAGREGVRFVRENTAYGKFLVFFNEEADYREVQHQFLEHLEEMEKNAAFLGANDCAAYRQDECCSGCEESSLGWRKGLLLLVAAVFIAAVIGFFLF